MPAEANPTTTDSKTTADPLDVLFETAASELEQPAATPPGASLSDIVDEVKGEERLAAAKTEADKKTPPAATPPPESKEPKADTAAQPPSATPPAATEPQAKPLKAKKTKDLVPAAPAPLQQQQVQQPPPASPAKTDDDSELLPEEKQQLKLAEDAERLMPNRYKGYGAKMRTFLKDHAAFLAEQTKKDPSVTFDEDNAEYQAWLKKNSVRFTPAEREELQAERIREEVRKENEGKFADLQDELFRRDSEPQIAGKANAFFDDLTKSQLPEDLRTILTTKGNDAARAEYALEFQIADRVFTTAKSDIEELLRISTINPKTGRPLKPVDPNNEQHQRLDMLAKAICDDFEREGGAARMKDGKRFVTRAQYFQYPESQRQAVWTFGIPELVERARVYAGRAVKSAIKQQHDSLSALGFRRQPAPAAAPAAPAETHKSAPAMPRPSAVPPTTTPATGNSIDEDRIGQTLFGAS